MRTLEGDDPRKRNVKTQIQRLLSHFHAFSKAVEHATCAACRAVFALFLEDADGVFLRRAGVNHQRFLCLLRRTDVGAKALTLPLHIRNRSPALAVFHAVVVQPCLTNAHHTRQPCQLDQIVHTGLGHVFGIRVHADGTPQVVMRGGQGMHIRELFHGAGNAQRTRDLRLCHGFLNRRQIGRQFWEIQMTVRIGKHEKSKAQKNNAGRGSPWPASEREMAYTVCVARSEPRDVPSICSILALSWTDLSSLGKHTPMPCARLPAAPAGVTQPTLPAMG